MTDNETRSFLEKLEREERAALQANARITPRGERKCPICGGQMRYEVQGGVEVDVCDEHGIWLDRGELAAIIRRHVTQERSSYEKAIERLKRQHGRDKTIDSLLLAALQIS
jgi:Zn-finger nucleic acid-binding protein